MDSPCLAQQDIPRKKYRYLQIMNQQNLSLMKWNETQLGTELSKHEWNEEMKFIFAKMKTWMNEKMQSIDARVVPWWLCSSAVCVKPHLVWKNGLNMLSTSWSIISKRFTSGLHIERPEQNKTFFYSIPGPMKIWRYRNTALLGSFFGL